MDTIRYGGWLIEHDFYGRGEYIVQYCGDEIWCRTLEEAKDVIDEINEEDHW